MTSRTMSTNPSLRLSAALLNFDKRTERHVKTTPTSSDFIRFELMKVKNSPGYVTVYDASEPLTTKTGHVNVTQFPVVFKGALLTYGKGELMHKAFAGRAMNAEAVTEFYLAVSDLTVAGITVLGKSKDRFFELHDDTLQALFAPYGVVKAVMELIVNELATLQRVLANGGLKDGYDQRVTVFNGKITPYGQYIIDSGKRHDKALTAYFEGKASKKPAHVGKKRESKNADKGELSMLPEDQKSTGKGSAVIPTGETTLLA